MAQRKETFSIVQDNLVKVLDVDDSRGRSVPINMNLIETGYLTKDTGVSLFGAAEMELCHSLFYYKKKDSTSHFIRAKGTKLQELLAGVWTDLSPTYTADARFGFMVYNDILYGCNGVENFFKWDGTTFTDFASAPKGNIMEVFEDRLFVAGVILEPLSIYYSDVGDPTTYQVASVIKPLGVDFVTGLKNYYGNLLIFKTDTIWKMTFTYDQVAADFLPKLEVQSGNYGACSRTSIVWVENDVWFFTGREVRSIGFKDQQLGVLGINKSIISDQIKETLYTITQANYGKIAVFYSNRRFYLSVPLDDNNVDTIFVCHLLYKNAWTKYNERIKANALDFIKVDGIIYSAKSIAPYGTLKWDENLVNDNGIAISSEVFFQKAENKEFNTFSTYRYLDLMFKNLLGRITVTIKEDANDVRTSTSKNFYVGEGVEDELGALGETDFGEDLFGDSFGEDIESSPFIKKRVSFLSKAQSLTIGLSNSNVDEEFTIAEFTLWGTRQPTKLFKPSGIVSLG